VTGEIESPRRGRAFGALRNRDFCLFWFGSFLSHVGNWMQQIAQSWLIYDLTRSPLMVGVGGLTASLPFVFMSLYAGTVVDRLDRKKILICVQVANSITILALAIDIATGNVQVWHIYLTSAINALIGAFQIPAQQALLPYLVPRSDLMTAISLNSILRRGTQIIGPSLGGISVWAVGVASTYFVNAATCLALICCLLAVRATNPVEERSRHTNPLTAIVEGFRYVRSERVIGALLLLETTLSIFGSYNAMLVIFARDIFEVGPQGLGLLQSASGAGTILGSLTLATIGHVTHTGRVMLIAAITYGVGVAALAYCPWFLMAIPILAMVGAADVTVGALRTTVLQLISRRELLGRVMSLHAITTRGFGPLGSFEAGVLAEWFGVRSSLAIGASICIAAVAVITVRLPILATFKASSQPIHGGRPGRRDEAAATP
jgi:MFS family permease